VVCVWHPGTSQNTSSLGVQNVGPEAGVDTRDPSPNTENAATPLTKQSSCSGATGATSAVSHTSAVVASTSTQNSPGQLSPADVPDPVTVARSEQELNPLRSSVASAWQGSQIVRVAASGALPRGQVSQTIFPEVASSTSRSRGPQVSQKLSGRGTKPGPQKPQ
jgi:hypothetical protein